MSETNYEWDYHDASLYFVGCVGFLHKGKTGLPVLVQDIPLTAREIENEEPNYNRKINNVPVRKLNGSVLKVPLKHIEFKKFPGITYENDYTAGYISFNPNGYKKGVSAEEYYPKDNILDAGDCDLLYTNEHLKYKDNIYSDYLFYVVNRKRNLDVNRFYKVYNRELLGCVLDPNYRISLEENGLIIFFKSTRVGYVKDKTFFVANITNRIHAFAKKVGFNVKSI
jgi:hypothetical protein